MLSKSRLYVPLLAIGLSSSKTAEKEWVGGRKGLPSTEVRHGPSGTGTSSAPHPGSSWEGCALTSGSGMTSGAGGGGAGGALTGVVDSGVSNASSESELLPKSLARPWQEGVGASAPSPAEAEGRAACAEAAGGTSEWAAAGEVLWAVRSVETWLMTSPWWEEAATGGFSRSSGAAAWVTSSATGERPGAIGHGRHGAAFLRGRNCQGAPEGPSFPSGQRHTQSPGPPAGAGRKLARGNGAGRPDREQAPRRAGRSCCTKANEWERAGRAPPPAPPPPAASCSSSARGSPPGPGMRGAAGAPRRTQGPSGAQPAGHRRSGRRAAAAPQCPAHFFQEPLSHDNLLQFLVFPRRFPLRRVTRGGTGV